VAAEAGGEDHLAELSEGTWNRVRQEAFAPTPTSQRSSGDDTELPSPSVFSEAAAWARGHEANSKDALAWTRNRTPPTVDLRLAESSLPVVSDLLVTGDMPMARTALIALQLNGGEVETDAEWDAPSTRFEVRFPDGTGKTVDFPIDG
jgi:hypothetical protein